MVDSSARRIALLCLVMVALPGCGKKGPLYLPDAASEVVTRPAETPPATGQPEAPNSPQTVDSQPTAPAAAPEVSTPEPKKEVPKKEQGATPPPHL